MTRFKKLILSGLTTLFSTHALALDTGAQAPQFTLQNQHGQNVSIAPNTEKAWTVLYFYPKADTPGCTKQACAFRDAIKVIEKDNIRVYGISTNTVQELKEFQDKYKLNFTLLSDAKGEISSKFGAKMPIINISKRYTFILDDTLKIRSVDRDVDPALDAKNVAEKVKELRSQQK